MSPTVDAVLKILSEGLGIAKPLIEEGLAQRYDNEARGKYSEWQNSIEVPNPDARADRMHEFIHKLCIDAGTPPGSLQGNYSVPLSHLHALVSIAIENVKQDKLLASAVYSIKKK